MKIDLNSPFWILNGKSSMFEGSLSLIFFDPHIFGKKKDL